MRIGGLTKKGDNMKTTQKNNAKVKTFFLSGCGTSYAGKGQMQFLQRNGIL
jgi:hypothetical protein